MENRPITLEDLMALEERIVQKLEERLSAKMKEYIHEDTERLRKIVQEDIKRLEDAQFKEHQVIATMVNEVLQGLDVIKQTINSDNLDQSKIDEVKKMVAYIQESLKNGVTLADHENESLKELVEERFNETIRGLNVIANNLDVVEKNLEQGSIGLTTGLRDRLLEELSQISSQIRESEEKTKKVIMDRTPMHPNRW